MEPFKCPECESSEFTHDERGNQRTRVRIEWTGDRLEWVAIADSEFSADDSSVIECDACGYTVDENDENVQRAAAQELTIYVRGAYEPGGNGGFEWKHEPFEGAVAFKVPSMGGGAITGYLDAQGWSDCEPGQTPETIKS